MSKKSPPRAQAKSASGAEAFAEPFGLQLRRWRQEHNRGTQSTVAERMGVSQSFVTQLESSKVANISPELIDDIAKAYGVSRDQVLAEYLRTRYGVPAVKTALFAADVRSIDNLATWEAEAPREELWIVARRVVARQMPRIEEAIRELLANNRKVVYFTTDKRSYQEFVDYLRMTWKGAGKNNFDGVESRLSHVEIDDPEAVFLTSTVMVSDPGKVFEYARDDHELSEAFLIVSANSDSQSDFGVRITDRTKIRDLVFRLQRRMMKKPSRKEQKVEA